jgi:hypothetical protein
MTRAALAVQLYSQIISESLQEPLVAEAQRLELCVLLEAPDMMELQDQSPGFNLTF